MMPRNEVDGETAAAINAWIRHPAEARNLIAESAREVLAMAIRVLPEKLGAAQMVRDFSRLAFLLVKFAEEGAAKGIAEMGESPNRPS